LLSPVNPKTDGEKCDRIRIGAILRLDDDENRAGLLLKPRCLAEEERADIDFRSGTFGSAAMASVLFVRLQERFSTTSV
jgi:hypothetical protein